MRRVVRWAVGVTTCVAATCLAACTTPASDGPASPGSVTRSADRSSSPDATSRVLAGDLTGREMQTAALSPEGTRVAAVVETLAGRLTTVAPGYGTGSTITRRGPTELWVWDVRTGARVLTAPIAPVRAMSFLPGGDRVLVDDPHHRGALLRAIDVTTGRETARYGFGEGNPDGTDGGGPSGHTPATRAMVAVSPDGQRLATYAGNGVAHPASEPFDGVSQIVRLWDARTVRVERQLAPIVGATVSFPPALSFTPAGDEIVAGVTAPRPGDDGARTAVWVARWSATSGAPLNRFVVTGREGDSTIVAVAPRGDGTAVAVGQTTRRVARPGDGAEMSTSVWGVDTSTGRLVSLATAMDSAYPTTFAPAISPDGTRIAVSAVATTESPDRLDRVIARTVTTTEVATGRRLDTVTVPTTTSCESDETVEYSPTGTTFLVAGCGLAVFDSVHPRDRLLLQSPADARACDLGTTAQYSADGTRVMGSGPCGVRVHDVTTGRVIAYTG